MIQIIGHRGLPKEFPDNTLAGIVAASKVCDMVEIDIRRTRDGVAILAHDGQVQGRWLIEHDFESLSRLDLGGGHRLCRLDELLRVLPDYPLNLEIKQEVDDRDFDPTFAIALQVARQSRPTDLITCFHWPTVRAVRRSAPAARTGLLVSSEQSVAAAIEEARAVGHSALALHDSLLSAHSATVADSVKQSGLQVIVWTVDDSDRIRQLAQSGVDALITNDPKLARSVAR